jgi:integrase
VSASKNEPPLVHQIPHITMLKEDNVRTGFFTLEEFLALRGIATDWLKVMLTIGYWTGMRSGEIRSLKWNGVDFDNGFIRLEHGSTKNNSGRMIPFTGDIAMVLESWWQCSKSAYPECDWVIHCKGEKVNSIEGAWKATCEKAGLTGRHFHDFRRCAVRNFVRAGISEHTAMKISGHKTRSIFDRYDIVDEQDLREAANRLASFSGILLDIPSKINESNENNYGAEVIDFTMEDDGEGGI